MNFVAALRLQSQRMIVSSYEQFLKMLRKMIAQRCMAGSIGKYATLQTLNHLLRCLERQPSNTILIRLAYAKVRLESLIYQWNTY